MRFGPVAPDEAEGAILAHSLALPGGRLRKGRRLDAADVQRLVEAGFAQVTVARLDAGDVHEDAAAARLAAALAGPRAGPAVAAEGGQPVAACGDPEAPGSGLRLGPAATGRVNLHAEAAGLLEVDVAAIHAVNAVDPALTVATLPPWERVAPGTMVATIKIITYAVPEEALAAAEAAARRGGDAMPRRGGDAGPRGAGGAAVSPGAGADGAAPQRAGAEGEGGHTAGDARAHADAQGGGAFRLRRPVVTRAALIETSVGDTPSDKGARALSARLERLGVTLSGRCVVPHAEAPLAAALADRSEEVIFVLTASATSDPRDTGPAALRRAGGVVTAFGMPVDPGNLLFLGRLGARPVIGLPGCARSPALNGADWVLERVICGVPVGPDALSRMGVGGLLKEIPERGRPRGARPDP